MTTPRSGDLWTLAAGAHVVRRATDGAYVLVTDNVLHVARKMGSTIYDHVLPDNTVLVVDIIPHGYPGNRSMIVTLVGCDKVTFPWMGFVGAFNLLARL